MTALDGLRISCDRAVHLVSPCGQRAFACLRTQRTRPGSPEVTDGFNVTSGERIQPLEMTFWQGRFFLLLYFFGDADNVINRLWLIAPGERNLVKPTTTGEQGP